MTATGWYAKTLLFVAPQTQNGLCCQKMTVDTMMRRRFLTVALATLLPTLLSACGQAQTESKVLCERTSAYNTIFVVDEPGGLRELRFERFGARQSVAKPGDPDHIELPYLRAILVGLALGEQPQRVLIIGLGGGTLPTFLHRHYPKMTIDVVDIDPEVVRAAKEFFDFREDERLRAHVADGRKFIEKVAEPYDVIFLDAYSADNIPLALATEEFLVATRKAVKPAGVVVSNVWSRDSNKLYDRMIRTYQDVFAEVYVLDVPNAGNKIVFAPPRAHGWKAEDVAARAATLGKQLRLRFELDDIVTRGLTQIEAKHAVFHPLRDAEIEER